ncbi:hypothetical protein KBA73_00780 [Patescibacteria group bacterium]|nr:hypothetical protein [Patescibacteria group bacterium]
MSTQTSAPQGTQALQARLAQLQAKAQALTGDISALKARTRTLYKTAHGESDQKQVTVIRAKLQSLST